MKTVGIVAEYNPLHTGHRYHIEESKNVTGADAAIVVMSGACVQRGGWASFGKSFRAACAVHAGADLVLELPYPYSGQSAETFADGAVRILTRAGADTLCFGSEAGSLSGITEAAQILAEEPEYYREELKNGLSSGLSFPAAREKAVAAFSPAAAAVLASPNNILGVEYLKAILKNKSRGYPSAGNNASENRGPMEAFTIRRIGADYHQGSLSGAFASASAIRKALETTDHVKLDQAAAFLPYQKLSADAGVSVPELIRGSLMVPDTRNQFTAAASRLLTMTEEELLAYPGTGGGLAGRLLRSAGNSSAGMAGMLQKNIRDYDPGRGLDDLIRDVKTRQQTWTAIERTLTALLMNVTREQLAVFMQPDYVPYLRVLAMNRKGREILRNLKQQEVPVIGTPSTGTALLTEPQKACWTLESRACDLQSLLCRKPVQPLYSNDYGCGSNMRTVPLYLDV
ncbi:MAG: nucleotidyltransferase family protein [Eubacteriaceae bacterium]